jgi:Mg-chelatase subunit ChlD
VVVLDTSTTMGGRTSGGRTKIEAAKSGASYLAHALASRGKRVGLVAFAGDAETLVRVTDRAGDFDAGLDRIRLAEGSRIDLGLNQAGRALDLAAPDRPPGARTFALLASDGQPAGATAADVIRAARALTGAGVRIQAVAVGADADFGLLTDVAGEGAVWDAGDGEGFARAVPAILGSIDCR